jgi:hypothetical protein
MSVESVVEFYDGDSIVSRVNSTMVPTVGSKISIRKEVWTVVNVTYALDYADKVFERQMRANVSLEKVT